MTQNNLPQRVADVRSNLGENLVHAARAVGRSKHRLAVFRAIYHGKKKWKTVGELSRKTGLARIRVLQEGGRLYGNQIVGQSKVDGDTAYSKDPTLSHHKAKILALAGNPAKQNRIATKQNPRGTITHKIVASNRTPPPRRVTIDEIASFNAVRAISTGDPKIRIATFREELIKAAFKSIIGETHTFKDWGGEANDLFTNKLKMKSQRTTAVFAFKGRATKGTLTPGKMGKNGDQIGRLFAVHAGAYFVVYHGKVAESVYEQMQAFAVGRSLSSHKVTYCVIDGDDLNRLYQAYPKHFAAR